MTIIQTSDSNQDYKSVGHRTEDVDSDLELKQSDQNEEDSINDLESIELSDFNQSTTEGFEIRIYDKLDPGLTYHSGISQFLEIGDLSQNITHDVAIISDVSSPESTIDTYKKTSPSDFSQGEESVAEDEEDYLANSSQYVPEDELDRKSDYFTQIIKLEFNGADSERLLEEDNTGILQWYESDPEKVKRDLERILRTAKDGELPSRYEEKFAEALAEERFDRIKTIYEDIDHEYDEGEELEEFKQDLLTRLWT